MLNKKCPYCKNKLHITRTSPVIRYGCSNCMKLSKELLSKGFSKLEVEKIIRRK